MGMLPQRKIDRCLERSIKAMFIHQNQRRPADNRAQAVNETSDMGKVRRLSKFLERESVMADEINSSINVTSSPSKMISIPPMDALHRRNLSIKHEEL
jgi:hypothetical protein